MEKIDDTIKVICLEVQAMVEDGLTERATEMTKALAALITAKANLNMSVRMHEGKRINQDHQR